MTEQVPRTFRRESRLFLAVALLLILFLNFVTLLFFRNASAWASVETERRASEVLARLLGSAEPADSLDRTIISPDILFAAEYDAGGRRVRFASHELQPPVLLPTERPTGGRVVYEWKTEPRLLLACAASRVGYALVGIDPGPGAALRSYARSLTIVVPLAGAMLVVLAWLYLRSLLEPYDRLLATAGAAPPAAPGAAGEASDERDFLIARFESTISALRDKERELETLARAQKERADDLEIAARTLARNLPTGLLSVDRGGAVVELNEAGREILGLLRDARGEPYRDVLAVVPEFAEVVGSVLAGKEAVGRREVRWGAPERVLGLTVTPAAGADGRFLGVLALFSDLTEIRLLEARVALARHLADLGEVSAGAAHEFRNAAAAIDGFADLAMRSPERAQDHLRAIRREAQEMSRVTSDFLLFARPDRFVPEPVSLDAAAAAAAAEVERAFPGLAIHRSGALPEVPGSPVLLRRAIANLLRNGAEATPPERRSEPGALSLAGSVEGSEARLSVADRGPGVDPAAREKIFLPFYSSKPDGSGFGLAIVARIAELHGGTVDVAPRPGGGAVFTLRLSTAPASARARTSSAEPAAPERALR
jgi:signal transduction histidine kinase